MVQLLSVNPEIPVFQGDVGELRKKWDAHQPTPPVEGVNEEQTEITARDGYKLRGIIFRPSKQPKERSALVVMIHPGAFMLGQPELNELDCGAPSCRNMDVSAYQGLIGVHQNTLSHKQSMTALMCCSGLGLMRRNWVRTPLRGSCSRN